MTVTIRAAAGADVDAICAIHNQGIADRIATLDMPLRSPAQTQAWLAERGPRHPVTSRSSTAPSSAGRA